MGTAVPWLAAYLLVRRCDANGGNDAATAWLHALLALGLALGLSSCTYFVGLLLCGGPGRGYCMAEIVGFAAGAGLPAVAGNDSLAQASRRDPNRNVLNLATHLLARCYRWSSWGR